ncbi:MAG: class I SAM-dependent methyltransferase [Planctomycetia bacterium]
MNFNGAARVYQTAVDMKLLDVLMKGSADAKEVADQCGTQERPTRLVLDALCSLGTMEKKDDEKYTLLPITQALLMGEYRTLGNPYWDHLPTYLETGVPLKKMDDAAQSERHYTTQARALAWMLEPSALFAAKALEIGTKRKGYHILDVGAGSGIWSLSMATEDPEATVTAVDWPGVLEVAVEMAEHFDIGDRLTTLTGNYHHVPFAEEDFDLAIVGNVTHLETEEGNLKLLEKIARALRPGGEIAIFDVFSGHPQGNLSCSLYTLGLALRTERGSVHGKETLSALLTQAGFINVDFQYLEVPPYIVGMLLAQKDGKENSHVH